MTAGPSALDLVRAAIEEHNAAADPDRQVGTEPETRLVGRDATPDSLDLVSIVLAVEDAVRAQRGREITLVDARALSREKSPFRTVGTLAQYLEELIGA